MNSMVSRVSSVSSYNPRYNPYIERTKVKDLSSLTFEQTKMLTEVKDLVSTLGDSAVKVQVVNPEVQENGRKIALTAGFMGSGISGTSDFAIGAEALQRMAEDKDYKQQMMSDIQDMIAQEKKNKAESAKLKQANQSGQPGSIATASFYMDFWNVDRSAAKEAFKSLYSQAKQAVISKYEANFAYM